MNTNLNFASINLDMNLVNEVMSISRVSTPQAAIYKALQEFIRINNCKKILNYQGKNIWEGDLNEMRLI